jgi:hypothetical protein
MINKMESSKTLRAFGGFITCLTMLHYVYQIYLYVENWSSLESIQESTDCDEIYTLQLWLLSQNVIWLIGLSLLLVVLILTDFYKLLLCFLYLMGPVYLIWTTVAIVYYTYFLDCCKKKMDKCCDFYPYQSPSSFVSLIIISLIFSVLISFYLLSIIFQSLLSYIRTRYQRYSDLYF